MNRGSALLVPLLLLSVPCGAGAGNTAIRIDAPSSEAGFQLRTRWGRWVSGRLPVLDGQLVPLPQGEYQVWLELDALGAEISDQPRYTRMTRGEDFFDADRHPRVRFESMPFSEELAHQGGELPGRLTIRGVERMERFTVLAASCERPLLDCPVEVEGTVQRGDYAMDGWSFALLPRVRLKLRLRGVEGAGK